jgi:hypothetical protein
VNKKLEEILFPTQRDGTEVKVVKKMRDPVDKTAARSALRDLHFAH